MGRSSGTEVDMSGQTGGGVQAAECPETLGRISDTAIDGWCDIVGSRSGGDVELLDDWLEGHGFDIGGDRHCAIVGVRPAGTQPETTQQQDPGVFHSASMWEDGCGPGK